MKGVKKMNIYIDADGCPVVKQTIIVAKKYQVPVVVVCDSAHEFHLDYAKVVHVSQGADSVDYAIANRVQKGDLVITQDYGLATMILAKDGCAMNQDGRIYDDTNIHMLLDMRYLSAKARRAGKRTKGPKVRDHKQNDTFIEQLTAWIKLHLSL